MRKQTALLVAIFVAGTLATVALQTSLATAQSVPYAGVRPRYEMVAIPNQSNGQAFQINTATGAMKFCAYAATAWKCFPIQNSAD